MTFRSQTQKTGVILNNFIGTEVAEQETQIKIAKSNLSNERNPFRYDSSDDDEEKEIDNKKEVQHIDSTQENEGIASVRNNAWVETFFFKDDDYRLQGMNSFILEIL